MLASIVSLSAWAGLGTGHCLQWAKRTHLGDPAPCLGLLQVCDLSALSDFEPLDPAQLASWGSIDTGAADGAALAAALAASGVLPAARPDADSALAAMAAAAAAAAPADGGDQGQEESPTGAEPPQEGEVAEASADLNRLSLGAGFE
jgi:hypothetical protein